jgi:hypothetical protein
MSKPRGFRPTPIVIVIPTKVRRTLAAGIHHYLLSCLSTKRYDCFYKRIAGIPPLLPLWQTIHLFRAEVIGELVDQFFPDQVAEVTMVNVIFALGEAEYPDQLSRPAF